MTLGDVVQSIVGAIGVLATLFVARMVFRLERRDREVARREDRVDDDSREDKRRLEEEERSRRARRYEHHREDYRTEVAALDELEENLQEVWDGKLSPLETRLIDEPAEVLERLSRRLPELSKNFMVVAGVVKEIQMLIIGSGKDFFLDVWEGADESRPPKVVRNYMLLKGMMRDAILVDRAARAGLDAIAEARVAITKEWGDQGPNANSEG